LAGIEDDLLEARQVFGGDEVVQGCVWYEVPGVFVDSHGFG
jgi:hypothetical protein